MPKRLRPSKPSRLVSAPSFVTALWLKKELLWQLSRREIQGRYRGSALGWGWSLITPLLMLAVYTFIFSQVFKARWGDLDQSGPLVFAINLFAGLIVFNVFSETICQSPSLMLNNINLVTKVIFPLEILPAVIVIAAFFHAATSLVVLVCFQVINQILYFGHGMPSAPSASIHATLAWIPLVWLPLICGCLSLGWILSALGVYLRDLNQVTGVFANLLMFLSAVFYPLSALPMRWQPLLKTNPLVLIIEQTRRVAVNGLNPSPTYLFLGISASLLAAEASYRAFLRARRGFGDVL